MRAINLYQIFDTKEQVLIADAITASEAMLLLNTDNSSRIAQASQKCAKLKRRYDIEVVDQTVSSRSPLWKEWDRVRKMILRR